MQGPVSDQTKIKTEFDGRKAKVHKVSQKKHIKADHKPAPKVRGSGDDPNTLDPYVKEGKKATEFFSRSDA